MAISYKIEVEGDLLRVTASGFDESLEQTQQYGLAVIEAAVKHGCRRVLSDERDLEYRLNTINTYQLAQFMVENAPQIACAAVVCHPDFEVDAHFFENVVVNRGLMLRMFTDLTTAEMWVME